VTRTSGTPGVIREFVGLPSPTARRAGAGGHPCQGLYHRGVGRKPKVAMIAAHYQIDFSEHYLADYRLPAASDFWAGTPGIAVLRAASCSKMRWSTSASVSAGYAKRRQWKPLCCWAIPEVDR
jgi:hypothetical protein